MTLRIPWRNTMLDLERKKQQQKPKDNNRLKKLLLNNIYILQKKSIPVKRAQNIPTHIHLRFQQYCFLLPLLLISEHECLWICNHHDEATYLYTIPYLPNAQSILTHMHVSTLYFCLLCFSSRCLSYILYLHLIRSFSMSIRYASSIIHYPVYWLLTLDSWRSASLSSVQPITPHVCLILVVTTSLAASSTNPGPSRLFSESLLLHYLGVLRLCLLFFLPADYMISRLAASILKARKKENKKRKHLFI